MKTELETPVCQYYNGGICLFTLEFPEESIPTLATEKTAKNIPSDEDLISRRDDPKVYQQGVRTMYFCRGGDVTRTSIGNFQKGNCDRYAPRTEPLTTPSR